MSEISEAREEAAQEAQEPESPLEARLSALMLGARPECAADVAALACQGEGDVGERVGRVLEKYPHFKALRAPVPGAPNPPLPETESDPFLLGLRGL